MTTKSAIFFSYSSQKDMDYWLGNVDASRLDQILFAVGGNVVLPETGAAHDNGKTSIIFEEKRLGKSASYNKAIGNLKGDLAFIISADIRFDNAVFSDLPKYFEDDVGMVIPRVIPEGGHGLAESISKVMWHIHDVFKAQMSRSSRYFCGGELQAVMGPTALPSPDIINDDEFLCNHVYSAGRKIRYAPEVSVTNFVPGNFRDLIQQRARVNYGHIQSMNLAGMHSSLTIGGIYDMRDKFSILVEYIRKYRWECFLLPLAYCVEILTVFMARAGHSNGRNYRFWHLKAPQDQNS